jgi:hypothetical protein
MKHTARQLAKLLDVQPSTITRQIKNGKLSAAKNESGDWEIDTSEIARVYADRVEADLQGNVVLKIAKQSSATGHATEDLVRRAIIDGLEKQLVLVTSERDDLRRRLDEETEERRRLTLLLTDQRQRHSWLERIGVGTLFGKA